MSLCAPEFNMTHPEFEHVLQVPDKLFRSFFLETYHPVLRVFSTSEGVQYIEEGGKLPNPSECNSTLPIRENLRIFMFSWEI